MSWRETRLFGIALLAAMLGAIVGNKLSHSHVDAPDLAEYELVLQSDTGELKVRCTADGLPEALRHPKHRR